MATVENVAKYFISLSQESTRYAITPLKLQKLVYYAQGYHLSKYGERLFNEQLEAWLHGPVVPCLYRTYRKYGYLTIPWKSFDNWDELTIEEIDTIDTVWKEYGHLDGKLLEELTHQEDPWLETDINHVIEIELIMDYFANQLVAH
ncbi:DUF4065 domain-containing protein [Rossellomorea vietnamensis]|uniref:DUF4065 domain-containing protein n=1 Tax=Rossellomorea vietnamensis TaxID=218284 RepID=A0A6I6UU35_9BACI|nr:type II toxin-antitoxin system antitoxin SocA domain-containing protein [Rossellomorea vietnamensis]QHE63101.1 DUF4065 domain-containing protein [Rossellomorea vietnamensis]